MKKKPSLAIWPDKYLEPLTAALSRESSAFNVVVAEPERCEQLALAGMVDISLVPSIPVFIHEDGLDVYSAAAISSWKFPFASIVTAARIGEHISRVEYQPHDRWYAAIAKIILNEHYGLQPHFLEAVEPQLKADSDAIVETARALPAKDLTTLDLGQEWFELTGYPMVWGLFACSKGTLLQRNNDLLKESLAAFKATNDSEGLADGEDDVLAFYSDEIRVGYDDLATASLTELSQFLYYYNIVDQPVTVPVIAGMDE